MKKEIIKINLGRMKNEVHVQFNESVNTLFVKTDPQTLDIDALYVLYKQAFDNEIEALDIIRKSELTAQISEQDNVRDAIFRGFSDIVKGYRNHFDHEVRVAANKMWNIFLHYGNIAIKTLDAETAAINDILREFQRPEIVEAMNKLNVSEWAIKLKEENDKFHNLMAARYNEPVGKTAYRMKTARVETDKYYRAMVAHIENLVLADKIKSDDGFNVQLNEVILHFKTILAQEFGRKNKL